MELATTASRRCRPALSSRGDLHCPRVLALEHPAHRRAPRAPRLHVILAARLPARRRPFVRRLRALPARARSCGPHRSSGRGGGRRHRVVAVWGLAAARARARTALGRLPGRRARPRRGRALRRGGGRRGGIRLGRRRGARGLWKHPRSACAERAWMIKSG